MTTFTTEDRILAEKDGSLTVNVEPIPFAGWISTSPPHIVDSGASVMNNEPVAYINVEERKLEWAKPTAWHTPTIAQMEKIPLYTHPAKTLTDEEINRLWAESHEDGIAIQQGFTTQQHYFAHLILKKASEK
jgi:hypothetical protein